MPLGSAGFFEGLIAVENSFIRKGGRASRTCGLVGVHHAFRRPAGGILLDHFIDDVSGQGVKLFFVCFHIFFLQSLIYARHRENPAIAIPVVKPFAMENNPKSKQSLLVRESVITVI